MIVGRITEIAEMKSLLDDKRPHLLMLTGRRRVGKTFLINEVYKHHLVFSFTGTKDGLIGNQLQKFDGKLKEYGSKRLHYDVSKNWYEAFVQLKKMLQAPRRSKRKRVVFFDEFPWINSHNSQFFNEFSYWWNDWASLQNIVVVISGSATAWMINKVINDRGGMHNRVTRRIHLSPFTLAETRTYAKRINPRLSDYNILELYMCMGGIPLYLSQIKPGESPSQSIYNSCFKKTGLLHNEFNDLYASLFENHERHLAVVRLLAAKWSGLTRATIASQSGLGNGGGLTKVLSELESCHFILQTPAYGTQKKGSVYRLADEYSRFYLSFIEGNRYTHQRNWLAFQSTSKQFIAWQGYAFENICIKHASIIKKGLGISGILSETYSYYQRGTKQQKGLQIDLLIDRSDKAINLCEVKFYNKPIKPSLALSDALRHKRSRFIEQTQTRKAVFTTLISTFGIEATNYVMSDVDTEITLSTLFELSFFD